MYEHFGANRVGFVKDPFGYSLLARSKWGMLQNLHGGNVDIEKPASSDELKDPILWLAHANSLSEVAKVVFRNEPTFENMPAAIRGVCDSQYCAVALMLVGYSLEVCLKAMIIVKEGVAAYSDTEQNYKHHKLRLLSNFITDLSEKELAILDLLSHFFLWAGRYPDPGSKWIQNSELVFQLSEKYEVSAKDLFATSAKVMSYADNIVKGSNSAGS